MTTAIDIFPRQLDEAMWERCRWFYEPKDTVIDKRAAWAGNLDPRGAEWKWAGVLIDDSATPASQTTLQYVSKLYRETTDDESYDYEIDGYIRVDGTGKQVEITQSWDYYPTFHTHKQTVIECLSHVVDRWTVYKIEMYFSDGRMVIDVKQNNIRVSIYNMCGLIPSNEICRSIFDLDDPFIRETLSPWFLKPDMPVFETERDKLIFFDHIPSIEP